MKTKVNTNGQLQFDFDDETLNKINEAVKDDSSTIFDQYLSDEDIRWEKLRYWLEQQMSERRWAGDVYRYTAYAAALNRMNEIERE